MNDHDIEATAADLARRMIDEDRAPQPYAAHVTTEDAVMCALESGNRVGLSEAVRAIVNAVVANPKTNLGANVLDVSIGDLDRERVAVAVRLLNGSIVPLVVAVAAH